MFEGKTIIVGITGGIAAYKVPGIIRDLKKAGADVWVMMTPAATKFVTPLVLEVVSGNKVRVEMWSDDEVMPHIELAKKADLVMVLPATANLLGKYVQGIADNLLLTTLLATTAPVMVCPSMNVEMWKHPAVQDNVKILRERGVRIVEPESGDLACGDCGPGRLPGIEALKAEIYLVLNRADFLRGKKVLITAGPTREYADPVRFLTNDASGKMGRAFALVALAYGAEVTMICGPGVVAMPMEVKRIDVVSAEEMYREVMELVGDCDVLVATAAVADFSFEQKSSSKIKKDGGFELKLVGTVDVLAEAAEIKKNGQIFIGFGLETEFDEMALKAKMQRKKMDVMVCDRPVAMGSDLIDCGVIKGGNRRDFEAVNKMVIAEEVLKSI